MALDAKERENAELTAMMETGGNRVAAGVRESKIVEVAKKNRALTLALEKEKAEKARLAVELKAARAGGATDARPRTTSQVETACREVVAEAAFAAESARKECAEWRERAKEAERRAERDAGRFNTARAENERFRAIIKREVGDDKVDFARLEDSLTAAGGWKGRAREIATLRSKVKSLRERLEAHEDGVTVASGSPNSDGSRPTSAVSTVVMTHERARGRPRGVPSSRRRRRNFGRRRRRRRRPRRGPKPPPCGKRPREGRARTPRETGGAQGKIIQRR